MNSVFEIQHELAALEQGIRDLHRIKADVDYKELGIDDGSTIRYVARWSWKSNSFVGLLISRVATLM